LSLLDGEKGDRGVEGPSGGLGLPGVKGDMGAKGFMGDKGDRGRIGVPGTKGEKGDLGPKGDKGDMGDVGMKGNEGIQGEKGSQGEKGMSGPIGPCTPAIQSAFSACLNDSFPAPDLPIPFPDVITNRQGHFNPNLGIYHAPVNGTYVFSYHAAVSSRVLKIGLFYNFFPIARTTEITNEATTSHQVVLHLYRGDMVWLQVKDRTTNGMFNSPEHKSTFSGYLLYPDSCELPAIRTGPPAGPTVKPTYMWDPPTNTTTKP
uniref:C1q domain-containing protein n=1 Tax=Myripristis murdjan TaxID=586833 RepID=A0A667Z7C1_9TELE